MAFMFSTVHLNFSLMFFILIVILLVSTKQLKHTKSVNAKSKITGKLKKVKL